MPENNKGVLMAKVFLGALSAVALITASTALAAGYGPQYGSQYGRGYVPNTPPRAAAPRFAPQQAPKYAPPGQQALNPNDPASKVSAQLSNLRKFLTKAQDSPIDPATALKYIEEQIAPDIDFATMTQMSLGRLSRRMTPQQYATAQASLRSNFTSKLVEVMGDIRSTRFTVGKTRRGTSRGELVVPVRLDRWRGQPLKINFRFYKAKGGWKVFDAESAGQSAIMFYRGYFARQWRGGQG